MAVTPPRRLELPGTLHIAYVCGDRGVPVGGNKGASLHVIELSRALQRQGTQLEIIAARRFSKDSAALQGLKVTDVSKSPSAQRMREIVHSGANRSREEAAAEARAMLLNYSILHALERLHRRHPVSAVYERYSLWTTAGAEFAQRHHLPYILEVNAPLRREQQRYRHLENPAAAAALENYLFCCADLLFLPSLQLKAYVVGCGVPHERVCVLSNAADPGRFDLSLRRKLRRRHREAGIFVVGFLGSLKPWHGVEYLAKAFHRLHRKWDGYRLLIVGDGPCRAGLESYFEKRGLGNAVTFSGAVDYDCVPSLLASMDAGVLPYRPARDFYFSPLKLFEYMAAGVPVVASDIGQISEVLSHERNALLTVPGRVTALAEALETLRRKPRKAGTLAGNARSLLRRRYTWDRNAQRIIAAIERRLARS